MNEKYIANQMICFHLTWEFFVITYVISNKNVIFDYSNLLYEFTIINWLIPLLLDF